MDLKPELTSLLGRGLLRGMKSRLGLLLVWLIGFAGCATRPAGASKSAALEPAPASAPATGITGETKSKLIVTPDSLLIGKVTAFNTAGRFVVLDFRVGRMPIQDQVLFVYRQGLKVGEVRVTGPERDYNTVADLISGEAAKGDEVRDK